MSTYGVVAFDFEAWKELYPSLAERVSGRAAEAYFDQACMIFNNTPRSLERDLKKRRILLYLLTAHIAQISTNSAGGTGSSGGGLVGRVASATRGSVSVSAEAPEIGRNAGWFAQTQYGLTYWQLTAGYRQMRFIPGRPHPPLIWP